MKFREPRVCKNDRRKSRFSLIIICLVEQKMYLVIFCRGVVCSSVRIKVHTYGVKEI